MLLRPDAQFLDKAVNRYERVFPRGNEWLTFRSQLPGQEVFANSVLDPAIGIAGELGLRAFASADWRNWTSAIKIGLFELSTRVGMPPVKDATLNQSLATVFDTLELTAGAFNHSDNPAEIVPELMTNAGMQVLAQVLQIVGASNPITFVVTQVIQIATWAVGIARARIESDLAPLGGFDGVAQQRQARGGFGSTTRTAIVATSSPDTQSREDRQRDDLRRAPARTRTAQPQQRDHEHARVLADAQLLIAAALGQLVEPA